LQDIAAGVANLAPSVMPGLLEFGKGF
jgi:hypothetical protein